MERIIDSKCYIGDILYFVMVDRNIITNKVFGSKLYKQEKIRQVVINIGEGISYWKDCYEMMAKEEDVDSYKPNWSCSDIFVFSTSEKAEKFMNDLKDTNYVNSIEWW